MTTRWIYRADFVGLDSSGTPTTFRYASENYRTSPAHPTLPNTWFDGRLVQPLELQRDLYGQARTHGDVQIGNGQAILFNADGGLDSLATNYGLDAQDFKLYRIDPAAPDTEYIEFRGQMESINSDDPKQITILVRDPTYGLDKALQPTKFAGNNSLPNGLEGTASDIGGKPKPICLGVNFNLEPILVNTSRLIYQIHDGPLNTGYSLVVYDKRSALAAGLLRPLADFQAGAASATASSIDTTLDQITFGSAHGFATADPVHVDASSALPGGVANSQYYYARAVSTTVISLHPTAADASGNTNKVDITSAGSGTITVAKNRTPYGRYDWCSDNAGSFIRPGLQPARITCDVTNPATYSSGGNDWWRIAGDILNRAGAFTLDNRVSASYSNVGVYWTEDLTYYEAIQQLLQSVNATFQIYADRTGVTVINVTTQRLELPGTPVLSLDASSIQTGSLKLLQSQDAERGIPAWRVTVNYQLNRTVMSSTDLAGVAAAQQAFSAIEYRSVQSDNALIKSQFPASPELIVDTILGNSSDASAHGVYLRGLLGLTRKQMYWLQTKFENIEGLITGAGVPTIPGLMLAMTVTVTYPRYDLVAGKNLVILGYKLDYQARMADVILWG